MLIAGDNRFSQISTCLKAVPKFLLSADQALAIVEHQLRSIIDKWAGVCAEATLTEIERNLLWRRQVLNPFAFESAPTALSALLPQSE
jgi:serine/threonine-protein kinase HipA